MGMQPQHRESDVESKQDQIGFRTAGEWSIGDLENFADAAGAIYDSLLVARVRSRLMDRIREVQNRSLHEWEMHADDPYTNDFFRSLRRALERGSSFPLLLPWMRPWTAENHGLPDDEEIHRNLVLYARPEDRLRVRALHMASPGGFSFQGIGEIIGQLRELVRDLWYRNRHERVLSEFALLEEYLSLCERHPDLNIPLPQPLKKNRYLLDVAANGVEKLRRLERDGKLLSPAEHLDYDPLEGGIRE